jgi:non-ribosomal peptide synthetase component F
MLTDAAMTVALTQDKLRDSLPTENLTCFCLDSQWEQVSGRPTTNPTSEVTAANLAYIIYTSGSTGKPKGVLIDHRGAVNTILDINRRFRVRAADRVLAVCSLNFDLSVYDVFGLLAAGGTIVLPQPAPNPDPQDWVETMQRQQVTLWNTAPPVMQMMAGYVASHHQQFPASLRLVMMSGDWIPTTLPDQIRRLRPGHDPLEIVSLGGATEASIWSILYPIETVEADWRGIPYGRPMDNQQFHILNERLQPVPIGEVGELFIGGDGVARGYHNRPELNASRLALKIISSSWGAIPLWP